MNVKNLEDKLIKINKDLPQLPKAGKDMIAKYFWVVAIIAAVFSIMAIVGILGIGTFGALFIAGLGFGFDAINLWVRILFGVVGMAIVVVMWLMSINPLKSQKYRGWKLAFYIVWIQLIFSAITNIVSGEFSSLITAIISAAIGLYLLMQVRDYFVDKKPEVKADKPSDKSDEKQDDKDTEAESKK